MTRRMVKIMSAFAALSIAAAGVTATASTASGAAPFAQVAQTQDEQGVLIVSVQRDGPAATAGLRRGDIVLKVNETTVNDAQALRDALAKLKPGDEVSLEVSRGGNMETLKVKLGDADGRAILGVTPFANAAAVPTQPAQPAQPNAPQTTPQQAEELRKQMEAQMQALAQTRVISVTADSPAAKAGLQKDDVILSVNDTQLDANNRLADVIAKFKPGDPVTLTIKRGDQEQNLKVTLGENPDKKGAAFLGIRYAPALGMMQLPDGFPNNMPFPAPGQHGQQGQGTPPFELPANRAAVTIGEVVKDSPAEQAGLKQGDVITAANGKTITQPTDLVNLVQASKPGDKLTLSVTRQGEAKPLEIEVTLGENPNKTGAAFMGVSLGQFIRFQREDGQGSNSEGFEVVPGFGLPFGFGNMPFPQTPQESNPNNREA